MLRARRSELPPEIGDLRFHFSAPKRLKSRDLKAPELDFVVDASTSESEDDF